MSIRSGDTQLYPSVFGRDLDASDNCGTRVHIGKATSLYLGSIWVLVDDLCSLALEEGGNLVHISNYNCLLTDINCFIVIAMDINNISNRTIFRVLAGITAFVGLIWLGYLLRRQLVWIGTAGFLAIAINPLVEKVAMHLPKKKRGLSVGIVFTFLLVVLGIMSAVVIPPLVGQSRGLIEDLPVFAQRLQESPSIVGRWARESDILESVKLNQQKVLDQVSGKGISIIRSVFSGLFATLTIITLTFFMLLEGPTWLERLWVYGPRNRREHSRQIASQMYGVVAGYVTGRLLLALLAAGSTMIMLVIAGVPFAIPLAVIVGVLDLVPLFGATLGAIAASLVALFTSVNAGIIMAVFFLIYQQLENNVLIPVIDSRTVQLSPLLVLMSALIGISLGGIIGALVAIPIAGCLQILAKDWLKSHAR